MSLRQKIVKGGAYLLVRQGVGMVIGLGGTLLLTRAIGPVNYGLYASALAVAGYLGNLAGLGVSVYIVRQEIEPGIHVYHQAMTLMFFTGIMGILLVVSSVSFLQRWLENPAFIPPLLTLLLTLPLTTITGVAMARLERDLNYRAVATIELAGQIINHSVALVLAYQGKGVWAPVTGYIVLQVFLLAGALIRARLFPRPYWSWPVLQEMIRYGSGYSVSMWIWQLRALVNPLIVGRYAGPEGVGCVALTIRMVDSLSFVKTATWRLSLVALAKLQGDCLRLKRAVEEAMALQVLALGPLLAVYACAVPVVVPVLWGEGWSAVSGIYPFIALGTLINAVFSMHSSVLYVIGRNRDVAWFHFLYILMFTGSALFFLPRFALTGYGFAELFSVFGFMVIHFQVTRLFRLSYSKVVPWLVSFVPLLFTPVLSFPSALFLWLPFLSIMLTPAFNRQLAEYGKMMKLGSSRE